MKKIHVVLVSSDREACGIREYGKMLMATSDENEVYFTESGPGLEPPRVYRPIDVVHINHHAALHAAWTPRAVKSLQADGIPVVVTQHDTFEKFEVMQERGFTDFRGADALVVHEPVEGLTHEEGEEANEANAKGNIYYIRQGVPVFTHAIPAPERKHGAFALRTQAKDSGFVVGTLGFPFPWKNYDLLCETSAQAGWAVRLIAPGATIEQAQRWQEINPRAEVIPHFVGREEGVQLLSECDATAFLYSTGNSGTSGAIRMGIAAQRPLVAFKSRQNKDLEKENAILWCDDADMVVRTFGVLESRAVNNRYCEEIGWLANRLSWSKVAARYLEIYKNVRKTT